MAEGGVRIWANYDPTKNYVWFGDVALGLQHGDDSALCWICCETGEQVAEYHGKIHGMELGEIAYDMGEYYGWAYGCFENNHDQTPNNKLVEMGYPQLHYEQKLGQKSGPQDTLKPGWNTNTLTRYWMVRHAQTWVNDGSLTIRSTILLDQMEIFAQNARGKYEAIPGGHDDVVFGFLGCAQMWAVWMKRHEVGDTISPMIGDKTVSKGILGDDLLTDAEHTTREERISKAALERMEREQREEEMEGMVW